MEIIMKELYKYNKEKRVLSENIPITPMFDK